VVATPMNNNEKKDKIEREKKPIKTYEVRIEEIEKWSKSVGEDIDMLQQSSFELKKELAQFVFQTVSAIMGFFAILLAIIIGFYANWGFEESSFKYVIGLLVFLSILLTSWFILWLYCNLKRK
jgi:hypothetical protein